MKKRTKRTFVDGAYNYHLKQIKAKAARKAVSRQFWTEAVSWVALALASFIAGVLWGLKP